ncbi:MAG: hypothetical protein EOM13_08975 [Clostridia bacterium]|nr:hypothetical protein [Clostridia bacterium]
MPDDRQMAGLLFHQAENRQEDEQEQRQSEQYDDYTVGIAQKAVEAISADCIREPEKTGEKPADHLDHQLIGNVQIQSLQRLFAQCRLLVDCQRIGHHQNERQLPAEKAENIAENRERDQASVSNLLCHDTLPCVVKRSDPPDQAFPSVLICFQTITAIISNQSGSLKRQGFQL